MNEYSQRVQSAVAFVVGSPYPIRLKHDSADEATNALSASGGEMANLWIETADGSWLAVRHILRISQEWFPVAEPPA